MSVIFGYDSLQDGGATVTSSNTATTYPVDNAVDWLPFDFFQPDAAAASVTIKFSSASALTADYLAIQGHDLFTLGARVKVEYSSDDISYSTALGATTVPDDGVFFRSFTSQSAKYWLVTIDRVDAATIQPFISLLLVGEALDMSKAPQQSYSPHLLDEDTGKTSVSLTGNWLGKSIIKTGGDLSMNFGNLTETFVRDSWVPFVSHTQSKVFIVSWDETNYPNESHLAWIDKNKPTYKYTTNRWMEVSINMKVRNI